MCPGEERGENLTANAVQPVSEDQCEARRNQQRACTSSKVRLNLKLSLKSGLSSKTVSCVLFSEMVPFKVLRALEMATVCSDTEDASAHRVCPVSPVPRSDSGVRAVQQCVCVTTSSQRLFFFPRLSLRPLGSLSLPSSLATSLSMLYFLPD